MRAPIRERVHEVADRTLVHARDAGKPIVAAPKREHRGERPKGGARVAEKEIGLLTGNAPPVPCDGLAVERDAERAQRLEHIARVVGVEQVAERGIAAASAASSRCGWRCSSSPAAAPSRDASGASSRISSDFSQPLRRARRARSKQLFERLAVAFLDQLRIEPSSLA